MTRLHYLGRYLTGTEASAIAQRVCDEQGIDREEMLGLMRRLSTEEDARDTFFDLTDIEVIVA